MKRNKRSSKAQYNEFLKLNEKKLKGKIELQLGVKYILPSLESATETKTEPTKTGAKTIKEPLFGKELEQVKVTGSRLKGACFYVVSGHGGPDQVL